MERFVLLKYHNLNSTMNHPLQVVGYLMELNQETHLVAELLYNQVQMAKAQAQAQSFQEEVCLILLTEEANLKWFEVAVTEVEGL